MEIPDINKRIKTIIEIMVDGKELTFANSINVSQPRINRLFNVDSRNNKYPLPSLDIIQNIINKFIEINPEWLLTGKGPMLKETIDNACMPNNAIPLITEEVILKIKDSNFKIPNEDIQQQYVIPDFENVDFLTPIKGSSMYPKYSPGDLVACRILHNPKYIQWNKIYIIITKDQGILYKRLLPSELEDHYQLVSDNDEYPPFDIPIDEITNIALVIGAIRLE